jgi:hypothetical protein
VGRHFDRRESFGINYFEYDSLKYGNVIWEENNGGEKEMNFTKNDNLGREIGQSLLS